MLVFVVALGFGVQAVHADAVNDISGNACKQIKAGQDGDGTIPGCGGKKENSTKTLDGKDNSLLNTIRLTMLYVAGVTSTLFLIIGGMRYITSTGDAARIASAKNTILYAIIGLIVTIVAVPISGFVITKIT